MNIIQLKVQQLRVKGKVIDMEAEEGGGLVQTRHGQKNKGDDLLMRFFESEFFNAWIAVRYDVCRAE